EIPTWRALRAPCGCTTRSPPVSGTIVQEAPAGTEPTGWPLPSSVTNNSPSPPSVMLAAPSASPTRSSGSTPGVRGAAEGCGRGQAAAARARRLASPRLAQGRVELCDGEVDVGIRVRAGDEPRLEGRGREEHTPGERRAMPPRKQARVRTLRLRERAHRPRGEIDAPHRAGMTPGRRDAVPARGRPHTRHQPGGPPRPPVTEAGTPGIAALRLDDDRRDFLAAAREHRLHGRGIVERHGGRQLGERAWHAGAVRESERRDGGPGLHQEAVGVPVIAALELEDDLAPGR